jgi:glycerol-3-phosphate dehydrogenase
MASKTYDLLVIGGGITGVAVAHDAALRGLSVALVERRDFGSATSMATSKLVHGGLRYLKTLEIGLVRESLRERRYLEVIAPHLVAPIPFLVPTYPTPMGNIFAMTAAMFLYDRLSFDKARLDDLDRRVGGWSLLSRRETMVREPGISEKGLQGGVTYYDCQMVSPDRLTWEFVESAMENGAEVANYTEVVSILTDKKRVHGATVKDAFTGKEYEIKAGVTINAAGPWADFITQMLGQAHAKKLVRSQGIHVITRPLTHGQALVLSTKKTGRLFFVLPWRGFSLIGTTDTLFEGHPDEFTVTNARVQEFLDEINEAYPAANLTLDDVRWSYGGLRPIVDTDTAHANVNKASRKYEIYDHSEVDGLDGFVTVVGGKYTTSRALGERLTEIVCSHLNLPRPARVSQGHVLPGGRIGSWAGFKTRLIREFGLHSDDAAVLLAHYGARTASLLAAGKETPELAERVRADMPDPMSVIGLAVKNELALTLDDVLYRRTGLGTAGGLDDATIKKVAETMTALLDWKPKRKADEIAKAKAKAASRGIQG